MKLALGVLVCAIQPATAQVVQDVAPTDRLLLKLEHVLPPSAEGALLATGDPTLDRALADAGLRDCQPVFRHPPRGWRDPLAAERAGLDRWVRVRFAEDRADLELVAARFAALPAVEACQLDVLGTAADTTPNDPSFSGQYSLQNDLLNAPQAWDVLTDSDHVVAIIDSGADLDHPELQPNLWANPGEIPGNGIDDEGNGYVDDVVGWDFASDDETPEDGRGHGTHVSGIAGARGNNAHQITGVCWSVPLMQVQVIADDGGLPQSRAAAGIVYAADNGASVLNNSYGYYLDGLVLRDAVEYAAALDTVIVAAAHNQGAQARIYPAAYLQAMGIIATDAQDQKASFSNYGTWCDMAAPGQSVLSLWLGGGTTHGNGTSMSSPHVAGAAALVLAANPSLDAVDARWVLNYSAVDLGDPGDDIFFGWGRLDLLAALLRARSLSLSTNVASSGTTVTLALSQPDEPDFLYLLLASRKGRSPGTPASIFDPGDPRRIPINDDAVLYSLIRNSPSLPGQILRTPGGFVDFIGRLDGAGRATAVLHVPALAPAMELDFAFVTFDPSDLSRISSISASNRLRIE